MSSLPLNKHCSLGCSHLGLKTGAYYSAQSKKAMLLMCLAPYHSILPQPMIEQLILGLREHRFATSWPSAQPLLFCNAINYLMLTLIFEDGYQCIVGYTHLLFPIDFCNQCSQEQRLYHFHFMVSHLVHGKNVFVQARF